MPLHKSSVTIFITKAQYLGFYAGLDKLFDGQKPDIKLGMPRLSQASKKTALRGACAGWIRPLNDHAFSTYLPFRID